MSVRDFEPGTPVLVYLHTPREKVFGVLLSLQPAGIALRGIDALLAAEPENPYFHELKGQMLVDFSRVA